MRHGFLVLDTTQGKMQRRMSGPNGELSPTSLLPPWGPRPKTA